MIDILCDSVKISLSEDEETDSPPPMLSSDDWRACTSWEYDTTFWQRTIIMDFDLVCDVSPGNLIPPLTSRL